ncbi:FadR/GntR family transcriptional regulator [Acinetobacter sp. WZC-1]|uniref:FadR/GntR family transcriptional regulator n=1 Tax=Acinetobacter sp. WZC-1 TaxID=3459034 RepID=UPI00403DCBA7
MLNKIKKNSLVDETIQAIRRNIQNQTWKMNERIPAEAELSEIFGIGRNTVREAVKILAYLGVLEVCQGDGTYVRAVDDFSESILMVNHAYLRDHLEIRYILDIEVARFAAQRRTDEDIQNIFYFLEKRSNADYQQALDEFLMIERDLHLAIAASCHNQALYGTYRYFVNSSLAYTRQIILDHRLQEPSQQIHENLVKAIVQGLEDEAIEIARGMSYSLIQLLENVPDRLH